MSRPAVALAAVAFALLVSAPAHADVAPFSCGRHPRPVPMICEAGAMESGTAQSCKECPSTDAPCHEAQRKAGLVMRCARSQGEKIIEVWCKPGPSGARDRTIPLGALAMVACIWATRRLGRRLGKA